MGGKLTSARSRNVVGIEEVDVDAALLDRLRDVAPEARILTEPAEVGTRSHDWWPRMLMRRRAGEDLAPPDAVVSPASVEEVQATLRWCHDNDVAVVPFGAGTGVCGGAAPVAGAITLDLKRLTGIGAINASTGSVHVQPGVIGQTLEDHLLARGWTLGHHPSSIHCSTMGGFLAVRSAGQESSFYGKLEDMVIGLDVVLADGRLLSTPIVPSSASGIDLNRLFMGGEGTTGIIVGATLQIWPKPEIDLDRGFLFPDVASGLAAGRALLRTGLRPHVFRLYDEVDTAIVFSGQGLQPPQGCLSIVGASGDPDVAEFVAATAWRIFEEHGGQDLGAEPGENWRAHRHNMSYRFAQYFKPGGDFGDALTLDTMEIAATWDRLVPMYESVKAALSEHVDLVMAHFSHVYPTGGNIYFTLGAVNEGDEDKALARYDAAWQAGARAAIAAGGTMSHHHGVGLLRAPFLPEELGEVGMDVLTEVKRALDPKGLLNPGKLGIDLRGQDDQTTASGGDA